MDWRELIKLTPAQRDFYSDQLAAQTSRILYDGDLETAAELKAAGWTPEPITPDSQMMGWQPRRSISSSRKRNESPPRRT